MGQFEELSFTTFLVLELWWKISKTYACTLRKIYPNLLDYLSQLGGILVKLKFPRKNGGSEKNWSSIAPAPNPEKRVPRGLTIVQSAPFKFFKGLNKDICFCISVGNVSNTTFLLTELGKPIECQKIIHHTRYEIIPLEKTFFTLQFQQQKKKNEQVHVGHLHHLRRSNFGNGYWQIVLIAKSNAKNLTWYMP